MAVGRPPIPWPEQQGRVKRVVAFTPTIVKRAQQFTMGSTTEATTETRHVREYVRRQLSTSAINIPNTNGITISGPRVPGTLDSIRSDSPTLPSGFPGSSVDGTSSPEVTQAPNQPPSSDGSLVSPTPASSPPIDTSLTRSAPSSSVAPSESVAPSPITSTVTHPAPPPPSTSHAPTLTPTTNEGTALGAQPTSFSAETTITSTIVTTIDGVPTTIVTAIPTTLTNVRMPGNRAAERRSIIVGTSVAAVALVSIILAFIFFCRRRQYRKQHLVGEGNNDNPRSRSMLLAEEFDDTEFDPGMQYRDMPPPVVHGGSYPYMSRPTHTPGSSESFQTVTVANVSPSVPPLTAPTPPQASAQRISRNLSPHVMGMRTSGAGSIFQEAVWPPPGESSRMVDPLITPSSQVDLTTIVGDIMGIPDGNKEHSSVPPLASVPGGRLRKVDPPAKIAWRRSSRDGIPSAMPTDVPATGTRASSTSEFSTGVGGSPGGGRTIEDPFSTPPMAARPRPLPKISTSSYYQAAHSRHTSSTPSLASTIGRAAYPVTQSQSHGSFNYSPPTSSPRLSWRPVPTSDSTPTLPQTPPAPQRTFSSPAPPPNTYSYNYGQGHTYTTSRSSFDFTPPYGRARSGSYGGGDTAGVLGSPVSLSRSGGALYVTNGNASSTQSPQSDVFSPPTPPRNWLDRTPRTSVDLGRESIIV